MPYRVHIKRSAAVEIRKLEKPIQQRIVAKIELLKADPRPTGVKKLQGASNLYRVRVGDFRIIYTIDDDVLLVVVVRVADRKDSYD